MLVVSLFFYEGWVKEPFLVVELGGSQCVEDRQHHTVHFLLSETVVRGRGATGVGWETHRGVERSKVLV